MMERSRRLRALWNWLPAFRAVAETEHLPTAAKALHLSPASLSRSVSLLEDELGVALFDRVGRGLKLNQLGELLLASVRDGMRVIDEGVSAIDGRHWHGTVSLWAPRAYTSLVLLPLATHIAARYPDLQPRFQSQNAPALAARILRGELDMAVSEEPPRHRHLSTEELGEVPYGIYCRPVHPLCGSRGLAIEGLLREQRFAVPTEGRKISSMSIGDASAQDPAMVVAVEDVSMALEACRSLDVLAFVPDPLVAAQGAPGLHRLCLAGEPPPAKLYAVYRRPVGQHPQTESILELLRCAVAGVIGP